MINMENLKMKYSREAAKEILYNHMSDATAKHINSMSFLEDWIIDAMEEHKNSITSEDIKKYRKEGRLSGVAKRDKLYNTISKRFDENYKNIDFNIIHKF